MYISNLAIKNYKNFKDFEIDLKPTTLLIGENNVGKSNLLEAIGLIFSQEVSFFKRRTLDVSDFNVDTINNLKDQILDVSVPIENMVFPEIEIIATLTDFDDDQGAVVGDWFIRQDGYGNFTHAQLTYRFSPVASFDFVQYVTEQREFIADYKFEIGEAEFAKLDNQAVRDLLIFPLSKYHYSITGGNQESGQVSTYHLNQIKFELLDALRDAGRELVADNNNRLLFRILNAKDESEYQGLKKQIVGLQKAIDSNPALQNIKSGITAQLEKISLKTETQSNDVDFLFSMPHVTDLLKKLSLIYGDSVVRIDQNGTGRNNLLFISLMLSYIEERSKANSIYFRIIGIEEPEAHLHPNLQNHLATNLEGLMLTEENKLRKDLQVILTSHSTHITTKLDFENTVVLYRGADKIEKHYILSGFDNSAPARKRVKFLNKYFDAINMNMFYSRKIILVEGISEQLIIPCLYELKYNHPLETDSISIINVNGLAFKNFLDIIKNGFFIKTLVLTDSDSGTRTANRADHLIMEYNSMPTIKVKKTEETTFEKDLIKANLNGNGASLIKKTLEKTRPTSGNAYLESLGDADLDVEQVFGLIESHKSSFAYELMIELEGKSIGDFNLPNYIWGRAIP